MQPDPMQPDPLQPDRHPADDPLQRPFPSEAEWLQLPLPSPTELPHDPAAFTARTLAALRDDAALDQELRRLDRELPQMLLHSHAAPEPSPRFVQRTLAAIADERRARWQQLLARHVAPEPSPQFVARTLAALRGHRGAAEGGDAEGGDSRGGLGPHRLLRGAGRARPWQAWPLLAAAVIAVVWFGVGRPDRAPFEARLTAASPIAFAHHHTASPLPAVLAARSRSLQADGLVVASADGLWLQLGGHR